MYRVIDTNVLVVANNNSPQASPECVISCVNLLRNLQTSGVLVLDNHRLILREYHNNVSDTGQPGVGDAFLKWILRNQANEKHCNFVPITPIGENEFAEFPTSDALVGFDPSDRKFVAVALTHPAKPSIVNAVDSDWRNYENALAAHGLTIDFICPELLPKP